METQTHRSTVHIRSVGWYKESRAVQVMSDKVGDLGRRQQLSMVEDRMGHTAGSGC